MRKAVKGQGYHFVWDPAEPYAEGTTPTLTIKFSAGDFDGLFVQSRANVTITAIASDRRTLTTSGAVGASLERDEVRAFLKTTADTYYAVKIARLVTGTALLAEPLPREIDLSSAATLNFSMSYVDVGSANLSTSGVFPYTIAYDDLVGGKKTETGLLKVTPRPFTTGLDHDELVGQMANLADMIPRRQSDFSPQIQASLDELILAIRDHVIADGITEDEVFNQQSFKRAHAYCAAAHVYEMNMQFDAAEQMRAQYERLMNLVLRSVTLDLDGDGVVDSGEEDLRRSGGSKTDFRASYTGYTKSENDNFFKIARGMRH